jgi:hypothetical protein
VVRPPLLVRKILPEVTDRDTNFHEFTLRFLLLTPSLTKLRANSCP